MDLNLIRTLVEIVDAGNLSEAARRRNVTRSQMSKELKSLERQIGATLLRRTTRRLALTDAGREMYEHGLRALAEVDAARAAIDSLGRTVRGHVRLSVPTGLGEQLGAGILAFQQTHPDITLRVLFANRVFDLIAAEIDVALRVMTELPQELVAIRLRAVRWGLYASPGYLAAVPAIREPEDLQSHRFLGTPGPEPFMKLLLARGTQRRELRLKPHLRCEHFPFLRNAMLAGAGVALLPDYAVADDLAADRARQVLPRWEPEGVGDALYILMMPDRHPSHASRVLIAYLRDLLGDPD